jgi:hypothetical protein
MRPYQVLVQAWRVGGVRATALLSSAHAFAAGALTAASQYPSDRRKMTWAMANKCQGAGSAACARSPSGALA